MANDGEEAHDLAAPMAREGPEFCMLIPLEVTTREMLDY